MAEALAKIGDVAKVTPLKKNRSTVPWAEFEPYWNQLRAAGDYNQEEGMKAIGYTGGSHLSVWKNSNEVPAIALAAIRWALHEMKVDLPKKRGAKPMVFSLDQLSTLFDLTRGRAISDRERRVMVKTLAQAIAQADE